MRGDIYIDEYDPERDYEDVKTWWEKHKFHVLPKEALPRIGFMANKNDQKLCASWLYKDESADLGFLTWVTSNPSASPFDISWGIDLMMTMAISKAKDIGLKIIFSCTNHHRLADRFQKQGFIVTDENSTEMILSVRGNYGT